MALGDKHKDWDFLERHRDLVLDNKGFSLHTSVADKIEALAEDIWRFRRVIQKPGGNTFSQCIPWSHPVDTLIYGSWCLGGAFAFVALCATYGIQARHVSMWGHSAAEVHLGGRWRYVESIQRFGENGNNLPSASFAEVVLDPLNPEYGFCPEQQCVYWQTWPQCYSVHADGLWLHEKRKTVLCPQTVRSLYPVWESPGFKSNNEYAYELLPAADAEVSHEFVLRSGQAMRRRFWIGALDQTRRLTAYFHGGSHGNWPGRKVSDDGGDWFAAVNGGVRPLKENGGWRIQQKPGNSWALEVPLPLENLQENAWNTITLGCRGAGDKYVCLAGYAPLEHEAEACFCANVALDEVPAQAD